MIYVWKTTGFSADANKVGKELEELERKNLTITRKDVLEKARDKNTELHKCFDWDDSIAGEKWRLQQATYVLTSISVKNEEVEPTRYFVNVKTVNEEKIYKNIKAVIQNEEEFNQLLERAKNEFVSYKQKYEKMVDKDIFKKMILDNL